MNTRKLLLSFLFCLLYFLCDAQNLVGPSGYGKQENRFSANLFFRPPVLEDTICDLAANPANGDCYGAIVILRSDNRLYQRDSTGFRRVGGDLDIAVLDSARRSNDTLYFRLTNGGELAVKMQGILASSIVGLSDSVILNRLVTPQTANFHITGTGAGNVLRGNTRLEASTSWHLRGNESVFDIYIPSGSRTPLSIASGGISTFTGGVNMNGGNLALDMDSGPGSPFYFQLIDFNNASHSGNTSDSVLTWQPSTSRVRRIAFPTIGSIGGVPSSRIVAAGAGILGGGNLTMDRSFAIDPAYASFTNYYTKTNLQTSGQAAVHYSNLTNLPSSWPTSSNLATVLANGNTTSASDINFEGDNRGIGWWNGASRRWLMRQEATPLNNVGLYKYNDAGTPTLVYSIARADGVMNFISPPTISASPIWYNSNHPAGSAFTPTLTGANVLASLVTNSAGHITAATTRAMTAGDIGALSSVAPSNVSWDSFLSGTTAAFVANGGGGPSGGSAVFGVNMPSNAPGGYGAQIGFRNNAGYFRTLEAGTYGSWLQFADRSWVTSNFATGSGSGNYIQNSSALQSSSTFRISGTGQADGGYVSNAGTTSGGNQHYIFRNNNSVRWAFGLHGTESSGNAGSDFKLWRYNDAGAFLADAFTINRSSGSFQFPNILSGSTSLISASAKTLIPNLSGIAGTSSGAYNSAWFGFYESNGTTRQGYVGIGSGSNDDVYLVSDGGNVNIVPATADKNINLNATGIVALNSATKNHLQFAANGEGAPTFPARSPGTKVIIRPSLSASGVDFANGIESFHSWNSVPQNTTTYGFKFYGGTTEVARLSGTGQLSVNTSVTSPSYTSPSTDNLSLTASSGNSIFFNNGGANLGVWDAGGDFGIGATPNAVRSSRLQVQGNVWSTDAYILGTGSTPKAEFYMSGNHAGVRTMDAIANLTLDVGATGSINAVRILPTGLVGIGDIATPTTTLHVNGSFSVKTRVSTASATVTVAADDHTIYLTHPSGTGSTGTLNLPNPANFIGRELTIIENSASTWNLNYDVFRTNGPALETLGQSSYSTTVIRVVNGNWWLVSAF